VKPWKFRDRPGITETMRWEILDFFLYGDKKN
jgi:hypothetical protein